MMDMRTCLWIIALTSRGIYGPSWGNEFGESTGASTRTIWSKSAMILWGPSMSKFSATPSELDICMTQKSTSLHLQQRAWDLRKLIGQYATRNSWWVKFVLKLRTESRHKYRMSRRTINRTIASWAMKICVTSYLQSRLKTKGKVQKPRSIRLSLIGQTLYLTATSIP